MEYFIDKRVFVTGRKSVLGLDNPFNLTAFTNSQISLMGVSCAQNGLNIQAALDPITGTQINCTELGGTLLHGTTVTGGGHQFIFDTIDLDFTGDFWFTQYTETIAIRSAQALILRGDTGVKFVTPSIVASTGTAGQILTLQSSAGPVTGGTCEWADPSGLLNVGLGLTESPAGTVKLGGVGIGASENLKVANAGLWEVTENGTVADTNLSLGIGTNPLYGPGILSDISTTGTLATTGVVLPIIGVSLEIVADNYGTLGNSISIVPDGSSMATLVNNWNIGNPANTATLTYSLGGPYTPGLGEVYPLTGGSGLIPSTALSGVVASYPPQPIMYQDIPSLNAERKITFDTSILIEDRLDTLRSLITVKSNQGITLSARDTGAADMYIDLDLTSGVRFGNNNSPTYSYDFPTVDGLSGQSLINDGGNIINWEDSIKTVSTAINYTANNKEIVLVTTGATDKNITLPLAARANQQITIKKIDVGAGVVHILGNGVETIDGINDQPLNSQYEVITVVSNGTEWFVISYN